MKELCLAFILLPLVAHAGKAGERLMSVRTQSLASLEVGQEIQAVAGSQGRLIAFGSSQAWTWDVARGQWFALPWQPTARILSVTGDGARLFLLSAGPTGALVRIDDLLWLPQGPQSRPLPLPPVALAGVRATVKNGVLHVAGRSADGALRIMSLDLASPSAGWQEGASPGGHTGEVSSLVVQNFTTLLTLRDASGGADRVLLHRDGEDWHPIEPLPGRLLEGGARATGQAHALYLVRMAPGSALALVAYHTITGSWATLGTVPADYIDAATPWNDGFIGWEAAAGGARFAVVQLVSGQALIKGLDWFVIIVYLAGMTGIGLYFYLREKRASTADFFVGSRSIPFWAAGVSLYATNTSSISYIAIPAKAFETNWQYLTNNLVAILGLMFVAVWIVPLLRRLDLMSVFQYLEIRFHPVIRTMASALCMLVQIGSRLSVILFLPSLAIATMTGLDVVWCILLMGVVTIAYTALGGMKAVIWTDFVQLFVMFGGALFAIGYIVLSLDGGAGEFLSVAASENKMKLLDWSWDPTQATVWGFIFLVLFDVVLTFPKDQVLMQRVLSTGSDMEAKRSVWMFAAIMAPGGFLFYFIGTALYVFYQRHPERMDPLMQIDATFPLFIASEMPVGVTGLIIAGILAASMSTLSSIMNSVATLASVDFYEKLVKNPDPRTSVRFAELMTVVTGLIGIGAAYLLSRYDIHSLFDVSIELAGLLGGGFAGTYTLGMFTRRANWQGVSIGIAAAIGLTTFAWTLDLVHPYFYLAISIMICIVVGYLASLLFPPPRQSLRGLTIYADGPAPAPP
jgi:SSS family transporter